MSTTPYLMFRFTRPTPANSTQDDIITISPAGGNQFTCSFTYGGAAPKARVLATMRDAEVFRWVRNIIRLLEADTDPFADVQVEHYMMPITLLKATEIGDHYHRILDVVEFFLDTQKEKEETATPALRAHTFFYDTTGDCCMGH